MKLFKILLLLIAVSFGSHAFANTAKDTEADQSVETEEAKRLILFLKKPGDSVETDAEEGAAKDTESAAESTESSDDKPATPAAAVEEEDEDDEPDADDC